MKKRLLLLLSAIILAVVLTACGGTDGNMTPNGDINTNVTNDGTINDTPDLPTNQEPPDSDIPTDETEVPVG